MKAGDEIEGIVVYEAASVFSSTFVPANPVLNCFVQKLSLVSQITALSAFG